MVFLRRPPLPASPPLIRMKSPSCHCLRDLGAGLGAHEMIEPAGKLSLARIGEMVGEQFGNGEAEHAVAEELEPLIVLVGLGRSIARSHASRRA